MKKTNLQQFNQAVAYLETFTTLPQPDYFNAPNGRSLFLKRFEFFMHLLGDPQKKLRYIHIAGTSGKGSVAAMIHGILVQAGHKTGLYTSPYCSSPTEKIKVGKKLISAEDFVALVETIKPAIDKAYLTSPYGRPSWYEMYTALAILYFVKQGCDYAVLEVGLGGRHDATNIIPAPVATVITKIGLDHTTVLGKTISAITAEKAAIIKRGTTVFTGSYNSPLVRRLLQKTAAAVAAPLHIITPPKQAYQAAMPGKHQQHNAAIAQAVAEFLDIKNQAIRTGLAQAKLPCRFEIIQKNPLVILDGAHNESKMATTLATIEQLTYEKLYLIIALTSERNPATIFKTIAKKADHIFITRLLTSAKKSYPPKSLATLFPKTKTTVLLDPHQALDAALHRAGKNDVVLVTGSFFLAGSLREHWRPKERIILEQTP